MTTQTVTIRGKRTILTTRGGTVTAKPALPLEWQLQAAQVRRLRAMRGYSVQFTLAGDMAAGKRGPRAQVQAVATGLVRGEPDLRIYLAGGRLGLIENKAGQGRLSPEQVARHCVLARLGFDVRVVRAETEDAAADQAEVLVKGWLAANYNQPAQRATLDRDDPRARYRDSGFRPKAA